MNIHYQISSNNQARIEDSGYDVAKVQQAISSAEGRMQLDREKSSEVKAGFKLGKKANTSSLAGSVSYRYVGVYDTAMAFATWCDMVDKINKKFDVESEIAIPGSFKRWLDKFAKVESESEEDKAPETKPAETVNANVNA